MKIVDVGELFGTKVFTISPALRVCRASFAPLEGSSEKSSIIFLSETEEFLFSLWFQPICECLSLWGGHARLNPVRVLLSAE